MLFVGVRSGDVQRAPCHAGPSRRECIRVVAGVGQEQPLELTRLLELGQLGIKAGLELFAPWLIDKAEVQGLGQPAGLITIPACLDCLASSGFISAS